MEVKKKKTNPKKAAWVKSKGIGVNAKSDNELRIIRQLLVVQLVRSGMPVRDVLRIAEMSSSTLYKFLPKESRKR